MPTGEGPEVWMVKVNSSKVFYRFLCTQGPRGMFKMLSNLLYEVSMLNDLLPFNLFAADIGFSRVFPSLCCCFWHAAVALL